jgi:cell division protein FtsB
MAKSSYQKLKAQIEALKSQNKDLRNDIKDIVVKECFYKKAVWTQTFKVEDDIEKLVWGGHTFTKNRSLTTNFKEK